jgi:hypothetical protein
LEKEIAQFLYGGDKQMKCMKDDTTILDSRRSWPKVIQPIVPKEGISIVPLYYQVNKILYKEGEIYLITNRFKFSKNIYNQILSSGRVCSSKPFKFQNEMNLYGTCSYLKIIIKKYDHIQAF